MATWLPIPSSYTGFAHRFVDPALGFALGMFLAASSFPWVPFHFTNIFAGWNYWLKVGAYLSELPHMLIRNQYIVTTPNNLIASALVIQSWFNDGGYYGAGTRPAIYVSCRRTLPILYMFQDLSFFGVTKVLYSNS